MQGVVTRVAARVSILAAFGGVVVAGCGGTSNSGFAAKADAICGQESTAEVSLTRTPITSAGIATSQVTALVAAREHALAQLKGLTPPAQDRSAYQSFLAQYPAIESAWRAGAAKAASSFPPAGYNIGQTPKQALGLRDRAAALAGQAGLSTCAGKLPASEVNTLTTETVNSQLHPTASLCTVLSTPRFVTASGGPQACLASTKTHSATTTVSAVRGTLPQAVVLLSRSGGNQQAGALLFWYVKLGGHWMFDDAASQ